MLEMQQLNIILRCLLFQIRADNGEAATKFSLIGQHAKHQYFDVPIGIEVVNRENNSLISRCSKPFRRYLIARGGQGGYAKLNYKCVLFIYCSINFLFRGTKGDIFDVELHLKLRPNIGLLGFPNAGKSTLLKASVPEKSVKIADYAFTTVNPQVAFYKNETNNDSFNLEGQFNFFNHAPLIYILSSDPPYTLSVADLPGIIEGASKNRGRGYQFLKHLEYADIIVMVIDSQGFQLKNELDCPFR